MTKILIIGGKREFTPQALGLKPGEYMIVPRPEKLSERGISLGEFSRVYVSRKFIPWAAFEEGRYWGRLCWGEENPGRFPRIYVLIQQGARGVLPLEKFIEK